MPRAPRKPAAPPLPADTGLYEQVVASLSSGVIAVDGAGAIVAFNRAASEHLAPAGAVLACGAPLAGLPAFDALFAELRSGGAAASRREIALDTSSGPRTIGVTASPLRGPEPFNGVIFLFVDLTPVRQLERSAEINRQLAQIGELTAGVVHELRNPLSVISGMAELLLRRLGPGNPLERHAATIHHEAQELEKLIRQFLLFARPFGIERTRCAPEEIVDRAVALCETMAREKGVTVRALPAPGVPCLEADHGRLAQALGNMIRNAIEVLRNGGNIEVRIENEPAGMIAFVVDDDGPGIQTGPNDDLLSPFFSKKEGGTGLGLSICHRIATAHGGAIRYGNRSEGGASFRLVVPIAAPPLAQA